MERSITRPPAGPKPETSGPGTPIHEASPVLRDLLAVDRTRLANERTLLAYVRTAIGFLASGLGLLYLFDAGASQIAGGVFIAASVGTLVMGVARYRAVAQNLVAFMADAGLRRGTRPCGGNGRELADG